MKILSIIFTASVVATSLVGQTVEVVPTAFKTGLHEKAYEQIVTDHSTMLLQACDNDMDKAYIVWSDMLARLESLSLKQGVDIRGVKIWINVFWNPDGEVDHITYFPKPNCKNIDFEEFDQLLNDLAPQLSISTSYDQSAGISHYGSASFPIYHQRAHLEGN